MLNTCSSRSTVSVSQHNYSNRYDFSVQPSSIWPWLRSELLTKSNVRVNLTRFTETVKFAHDNGFKMHIGEANSMYAHGQPGVSNAAVAGLWVIDYALHAATLGVDAIHFHAGVGYYYNGMCWELTFRGYSADGYIQRGSQSTILDATLPTMIQTASGTSSHCIQAS